MHILFIASWYPNRNAPALGNFIQQHARAAALKHTVSVVYACSDENLPEGKTEAKQNPKGNLTELIVYYGKIRSKFPILSQLKKSRAYQSAIRSAVLHAVKMNGKPDVLHVHVIWPAALAVIPILKDLDVPLVISEHWSGYLPEDGNYKGMLMKNYSQKLANEAKHITVVSSRMEKAMRDHGLGNQFSILPNTIDTKIFRPGTAAKSKTKFRLLHVSMLVDREKNISGILRVMKSLESHPDISLEIIGNGPEKEKHEALAKSLGILNQSVFFSGFKTANEIAAAMQNSDALLMFSHFEGMPVTIIEAQSCGLPVIASRTGAIPEMVRENEGILVDPGNESGLKEAILALKEKRNGFSSKTIRERAVKQYSPEAVSGMLNGIYSSVIQTDAKH